MTPRDRKLIVVLMIVRFVAIGLLTLSLILSVLEPILAGVLIIAVAVGSNIALRLVAGLKRVDTILYLIYIGAMFGLGGLWLSSIITTAQAAIIFFPTAIAYWILSWTRIWKP